MGCVFFFQAADGIRDGTVTGVQTCALPISATVVAPRPPDTTADARSRGPTLRAVLRSEERRVGKECRSLWSRDHEKIKDFALGVCDPQLVSAQDGRVSSISCARFC